MREVKLSTKNQIVIGREVRKALGFKSGDRLLLVSRGNMVILVRKPKQYARKLGLLDGKFQIPDDFNAPLPDSVIRAFEGRKR